MSGGLDLIAVPQPHFIPGYTGYCPQYIFRSGETYGQCTHKLLVDPTITHADTLVLSDRTVDEFQVWRPTQRQIDLVKGRARYGDPVYKHPMIPGYEGFVPKLNNLFGQNYGIAATEALSDFEKQQHHDRQALHHLKILGAAQDDKWDPKNLEERTLLTSAYKLPLLEVRPEAVGVLRNIPVDEPAIVPPIDSKSPYFMDNSNRSEKFIKKGFSGHVPFGYSHFGQSNEPMTNSALCDFTSNYRRRQSTEWAPVSISRPDPPFQIQPTEIYHKHVGMIPNYMGHVPGFQFRSGRTFGDDTRDAKRWLRGDFRL